MALSSQDQTSSADLALFRSNQCHSTGVPKVAILKYHDYGIVHIKLPLLSVGKMAHGVAAVGFMFH